MKSYNKPVLCDVYMRKSNERDDKQVQSLETQEEIARKIQKQYGLKIGQIFKESKSARKPDKRPEFNKLVKRIETEKIDGIICWHLNRISRNPKENGLIHQFMEDGKIKQIYTDGRVYDKDDDLIFDVEASMNVRYSKDVMRNVRDGLNTKARNGGFPGSAPVGYANNRLDKTIEKDPDNWNKVRRLWDLMITGTYTIPAIHKEAEKMKIKLRGSGVRGGRCPSLNAIRGIFRNPFYCGYMKWNGQILPANHEAMVIKTEWDKVQAIMDDANVTHNTRPKKEHRDNLFGGGMLKCSDCGYSIVTETKKKTLADGTVKEYHLCRCSHKCPHYDCSWKGYVHESELLEQVKDTLSEYTIPPEIYKLALEVLNEEDSMKIDKTRLNEIKTNIKRIKSLQSTLLDKNLSGVINDEIYKAKNEEFDGELVYLNEEKDKLESPRFDWRELAEEAFDFARYAREGFENDTLENRKIIMKILGVDLKVSASGRTVSFSPVKWLIPIKKGNEQANTTNSMVRTGPQQVKKAP